MNNKTRIFALVSLASLIVTAMLLLMPITRAYQMHMFFASCRNFFADFLNPALSISLFEGFNPYHNSVISTAEQIYPPFAYILVLPFAYFFPNSVCTLSACYDSPKVIFITAIMMLLMVAAVIYSCIICCRKFKQPYIATIVVLCSGLMFMSLERGNLIMFAFAGIATFLCYYDSENRFARIMAAIGLAIAVSLKVTPVLFGVLWLNRRDFKYLLSTGVITFMLSFIPLLISDYSLIDNVLKLLTNVIEHERLYVQISPSLNISCVVNYGIHILALPADWMVSIVKYLSFFIGVMALWCAIRYELSTWKRYFLLAGAQVLIPSTPQPYVMLFFIPSLIAFLGECINAKEDSQIFSSIFMVIFFVFTTSLQIFVFKDWSMNFAFQSIAIFVGAVMIEVQAILKLWK